MSPLHGLLRSMSTSSKNWDTPESFARAATLLGLRDFGFPTELEPYAFIDGLGDLGIDAVGVTMGDDAALAGADISRGSTAEATGAVKIFLLQAKYRDVIKQVDIDAFGASAQRLLTLKKADLDKLRPNGSMAPWIEAIDTIRKTDRSAIDKAHLTLVFAYAGEWKDFNSVNLARDQAKRNLERALPEMRIEFAIWGVDEILAAGERVGPGRRKTLQSVTLLPMPAEPHLGYIGFVKTKDLALFASRKDGERRQALDVMFLENPRADLYQGNLFRSPGATGLQRAIANGNLSELILGHNGVVIIAADCRIARGSGSIELFDPQIINGCQSVNVMVREFERLGDSCVPVKIIVSEDQQVIDRIIVASNTQTIIEDFDMLSRHPGIRGLEPYFERSQATLDQLVWLQRRKNQQIDWPDHWRPGERCWNRVVQPRHLLEGFVSVALGEPHTVHGDIRAVLAHAHNSTAFNEGHDPTFYRALAWLVATGRAWAPRTEWKWQDLFAKGGADSYPARHQYVRALWLMCDGTVSPLAAADLAKSQAAQRRFQAVIDKLSRDDGRLADAAGRAVGAGAQSLGRRLGADLARTAMFTKAVEEKALEERTRLEASA